MVLRESWGSLALGGSLGKSVLGPSWAHLGFPWGLSAAWLVPVGQILKSKDDLPSSASDSYSASVASSASSSSPATVTVIVAATATVTVVVTVNGARARRART